MVACDREYSRRSQQAARTAERKYPPDAVALHIHTSIEPERICVDRHPPQEALDFVSDFERLLRRCDIACDRIPIFLN